MIALADMSGWEHMTRYALATRTKRGKPCFIPYRPGALDLIHEIDPLAVVWISSEHPTFLILHHQQWGWVHSEEFLAFCRETGHPALLEKGAFSRA